MVIMTKIVFMGAPSFAVPTLAALVQHFDVVAVVTQPDAPAGRGRTLTQSPVKQFALEHGLPVLQPASLKPPEEVARLRAYAPDAIVVAAFGQILRRDVLELPPRGCINVHASLLPHWRGASPISAAIAAGDAAAGVTIMLMDPGLDSGPILSQRGEPIRADDTTATLAERLSHLGADLLVETLPQWLAGKIAPLRQDESQVTWCGTLKKEDGRIDWSRPAEQIERHVRAMLPWPVAWTSWQGKQLQIRRARLPAAVPAAAPEADPCAPGTVDVKGNTVSVHCGQGALELLEVQLEGKRSMPAADLARGQRGFAGALLRD
jgi:methionyl-tRNA formyltransferase